MFISFCCFLVYFFGFLLTLHVANKWKIVEGRFVCSKGKAILSLCNILLSFWDATFSRFWCQESVFTEYYDFSVVIELILRSFK